MIDRFFLWLTAEASRLGKLCPLAMLAIGAEAGAQPDDDAQSAATSGRRPNILVIVADDMGYNELGSFGSEIHTPNLDALALGGLRFTNFHGAPVCAPARAMLMSGTTNHAAGIGSMNTKRAYDNGQPPDTRAPGFGRPEYVGHLSERIAALPEILSSAGYHTYMSGKWDLARALDVAHLPSHRGFESTFTLTTGTAVHLGFPDGDASSGLGRADPYPFKQNGSDVTEIPPDSYSSELYVDKLIEFIEADRSDERPFFAWLAFTAPHLPIQVPDDWRDRYAGRYADGYDAIRERRFEAAKDLGIFDAELELSRFEPQAPSWASLSADEKRRQSRIMELYAAMLENMDYHTGRLVDYLDATGALENTVIIFASDNGASGSDIPTRPTYVVDNSWANLGRYDSWVEYGLGWAEAATAPFRDTKFSMAEGGTRVAAFIYHDAVASPGAIDDSYLTLMDVAPTVLDIAGVEHPGSRFAGRDILPMTGSSFWPRALGSTAPVRQAGESVGWELHGDRALVQDDWKILMTAQSGAWELFDLESDPGESENLAERFPERLATLIAEWERFADSHGVVR